MVTRREASELTPTTGPALDRLLNRPQRPRRRRRRRRGRPPMAVPPLTTATLERRAPSGAIVDPLDDILLELTDDERAQLVDPDSIVRPVDYDYTPHPRQQVAHGSFADELLYGGAAGGGKSRFARAEAVAECLEVAGLAAIIFRRTFPDLARAGGVIPKLLEETPRELGSYHAGDHRWTFHNGSTLELAHLGRDADVTKYQGAEYQLIVWEEATHFSFYQYDYLKSRLRASGRVADRLRELGRRPRVILTANPGGVGHAWVKARFIDPDPAGGRLWRPAPTDDEPSPGTRLFIPAKVSDNPSVDEGYARRLDNLEDDLRRALRDGDWNVYQGQRFRSFRTATHVIEPEALPLPLGGIVRACGVDYGLDAPYAALWGAKLADGLVVVYRELYTAGLTAGEQADAILDAEQPGERGPKRRIPVALDPSTWARNPHVKADPKPPGSVRVGSTVDHEAPPTGSIAAAYEERFGGDLVKAYNGRLDGVALVADKLRVRTDGLPRLLIYSTCRHLIRTLPALPRDPRRPEDVDTKAEDHAYDALRYLLMELERGSTGATGPGDPRATSKAPGSRAPSTTTGALARASF